MPANAERVKSGMIALTGRTVFEVLSEYVRVSIHLCFKALNTLQNNMSRVFKIVLFIMSLHTRKLA